MHRPKRVATLVVCGLVVVVVYGIELRLQWGGRFVTKAIDDLMELAAAALAAVAGIRRGIRSTGRSRLSWLLIGAGAGCWAAGQAAWSYYELLGDRQTPFPSVADAGFLSFTALALAGLLVRRTSGFVRHRRTRGLLDGLLVAASLFILSWSTALGKVYAAGADSLLGAVVSMAYPVGDLLLLTLTLVVVSHAPSDARRGLGVLALGFFALSLGDSGFAYLTATGQYQTGDLLDAGWVIGFLLLALAAILPDGEYEPDTSAVTSRSALLLPYLPAVAAIVLAAYRIRGAHKDGASLLAAVLIVLILLVRQMLMLDENRRLTAAVRHQAFHDQLTGLANRALFQDRLTQALALHRRTRQPLTLLIVDLDDFKCVNDTLGHAAGDEVLKRLAERLRDATRAGDTVARLGGDEFAILGQGADSTSLAERVMATLEAGVTAGRVDVAVRASIGIAELTADDATIDADELLLRADAAMYTGKRRGKSQAVRYDPHRTRPPSEPVDSPLKLDPRTTRVS